MGFGVVAALAGLGGFVAGATAVGYLFDGAGGFLAGGAATIAAGGATFWGLRRWDRSRQKKAIETRKQADLDSLKQQFENAFFPKDTDRPRQMYAALDLEGNTIQLSTELKHEIKRQYNLLNLEGKTAEHVEASHENLPLLSSSKL